MFIFKIMIGFWGSFSDYGPSITGGIMLKKNCESSTKQYQTCTDIKCNSCKYI